MEGIELTRIIRKIEMYKKTPIVAVTAYASDEDRKKFLSKGMSHYISKPFMKQELINLLDSIFSEE